MKEDWPFPENQVTFMLLARPTSIVLKGVPLFHSPGTRADAWQGHSPGTPDSGKQLSTGPIGAL